MAIYIGMDERVGCECCGTTDLIGEQTLCDSCADKLREEWDAESASAAEILDYDADEVGYDPYSGGYSDDC